jgi:hypothetical protein
MDFKIKIPLTQVEADASFQKDMQGQYQRMVNQYGNSFRQASELTNLPVQVLYSFAMIESRGTHNRPSGEVIVTGSENSTGIMQISPNMFYEIYLKEIKDKRISDKLKKLVRQYVDIDFDAQKPFTPASPSQRQKVFNALKSYNFNILASSIVLRRLLEESANLDMTMRLDKVIVKYNVGMYSRPTRTDEYKTGDTTALLRVVPSITKSYITNIVGKNGAMSFFIKNNIT